MLNLDHYFTYFPLRIKIDFGNTNLNILALRIKIDFGNTNLSILALRIKIDFGNTNLSILGLQCYQFAQSLIILLIYIINNKSKYCIYDYKLYRFT